jgi:hypothetical protein
MNWRSTATLTLAVAAIGFVAGRGWSQDAKGGDKPMSHDEQMRAMAEMAAPAEQHKQLATSAGTWDVEMTMWEDPQDAAKTPTKSKGSSTIRSVLNGLYLQEEFKGDVMGMPYEGLGLIGYSKEKKRYFTLWADGMGTTPMILWGTADATGKVVTYEGEPYTCPKGEFTPRITFTHVDADHAKMEMWGKRTDDTEWRKQMELTYSRRK